MTPGNPPHAMPCRPPGWRRRRRCGGAVIHGVSDNQIRARIFKRRAICGRRVRILLYFGGKGEQCSDCHRISPELAEQPPPPGAVLWRFYRRTCQAGDER